MPLLACDVCGGNLLIDAGGKTATCQFCGGQHSVERMREKVQEIKGVVSIEGSVNVSGIANVESLMCRAHEFEATKDFEKAAEYYNRVLDIEPTNTEARAGLENAIKNKCVRLISYPADQIIGVIRIIREITGMGLAEVKNFVESCPREIHNATPGKIDELRALGAVIKP